MMAVVMNASNLGLESIQNIESVGFKVWMLSLRSTGVTPSAVFMLTVFSG